MTEFNDYEKIKRDVEDNVMARLHPTLAELLKGQAEISKEVKKLQPILEAWNNGKKLGVFGEWIAKRAYKIFLFLASIGLSWIAIKDSGMEHAIKHFFTGK